MGNSVQPSLAIEPEPDQTGQSNSRVNVGVAVAVGDSNSNGGCDCNPCKRLVLLGRQVLELVITDYLLSKYPEDDVTAIMEKREAMMNAAKLQQIANTNASEPVRLETSRWTCAGHAARNGESVLRMLGTTYVGARACMRGGGDGGTGASVCGWLEVARNRVHQLWGLEATTTTTLVPDISHEDNRELTNQTPNPNPVFFYTEPIEPPEDDLYWDQYVGRYSD